MTAAEAIDGTRAAMRMTMDLNAARYMLFSVHCLLLLDGYHHVDKILTLRFFEYRGDDAGRSALIDIHVYLIREFLADAVRKRGIARRRASRRSDCKP